MTTWMHVDSAWREGNGYYNEEGFLGETGGEEIALFVDAVSGHGFGIERVFDRNDGVIALMRAVLADGIECFCRQFTKKTRRTLRLGKEAETWLFSDDVNWPFSFINICNALRLEPGYLRRMLKGWSQQPSPPAIRQWRHTTVRQKPLKLAA